MDQVSIKYTNIFQHLDPTKFTQIWIFGFGNKPSGNPVSFHKTRYFLSDLPEGENTGLKFTSLKKFQILNGFPK
jgi:hypothetical protein